MKKAPKVEPQVMSFAAPEELGAWLAENHELEQGIWLRMFKKETKLPSVTYAQALDEALCWGWIDGQKKGYDERSWLQRFTPRRARSMWSKVNQGHVARLAAEGRMRPPGVAAVEAAKADGRWEAAYDPVSRANVPDDLQAILDGEPAIKAFFEGLKAANRYAILYRLQTAKKPETRAKRLEQIVEMLRKGETFH